MNINALLYGLLLISPALLFVVAIAVTITAFVFISRKIKLIKLGLFLLFISTVSGIVIYWPFTTKLDSLSTLSSIDNSSFSYRVLLGAAVFFVLAGLILAFTKKNTLVFICLGLATICGTVVYPPLGAILGSFSTVAVAVLAGVTIDENRRLKKQESTTQDLEKIIQWIEDINNTRSESRKITETFLRPEYEAERYISLLAKSSFFQNISTKLDDKNILPKEVNKVITNLTGIVYLQYGAKTLYECTFGGDKCIFDIEKRLTKESLTIVELINKRMIEEKKDGNELLVAYKDEIIGATTNVLSRIGELII